MMKSIEIKKQIFLFASLSFIFPSGGLELTDNSEEGSSQKHIYKKEVAELADNLENGIRLCGSISSEHNLMEGELSDHWAQELIGTDLLREEVRNYPVPPDTNFISVFDDRGEHSHKVRQLISGTSTYATLPELGDKISVFDVGGLRNSYHTLAFHFKKTGQIPSFINNSMAWINPQIYESFKKLSPPAIVVTSAGNFSVYGFSALDSQKSLASRDFNAILVGSFSPSGFVSEFSQEGEEVSILAPSDNYISTADSNGEYSQFGGTSGAAPLVTGALAAFEWISAYHPSSEEAKILLQLTALPTLHSYERPRLNGTGLLNTYKLGRVAQRLKAKCQKDETENETGDPLGAGIESEDELKRKACFQTEIRNEENYHFPEDETLLTDLSKAFPACYTEGEGRVVADLAQNTTNETSCEEKTSVFKRLRVEALLSPKRELYESLSCIYQAAGFSQNALMLDRLALALDPPGSEFLNEFLPLFKESVEEYRRLRLLIVQTLFEEGRKEEVSALSQSEDVELRESLAPVAAFLEQEEALSLLRWLIRDTDENVRMTVAQAARYLGAEEGLNLLRELMKDTSAGVKRIVALSIVFIGGEEGFHLLEQLIQDTSAEVRKAIVGKLDRVDGEEGLKLLKQLVYDENAEVRGLAARAAGRIGGEEGLKLLEQLIYDKNAAVRSAVARAAGVLIGGEEGLNLLKQLIQDPDEHVRRAVVWGAGLIGGGMGFKLLKQLVYDENTEVRAAVARITEYIDDEEEALSLMEQLIQDTSTEVRREIIISAQHIGGEVGLTVAQQLTQDKDEVLRWHAEQVLEELLAEREALSSDNKLPPL